MLHQMKIHPFSKINREVGKVFLILIGQDDIFDVVSEGGEGLLLQPPDRKDPASQSDLAGQGYVLPCGDPC